MKTLPTGETMGAIPDNIRGPEDLPDFISVFGDGGIQGYARKSDLFPPEATSPEEAIARQKLNEGKERRIPVFAEDGETVIGGLTLQSPS